MLTEHDDDDELTLMWHIVLRLQGHITVIEESRSSQCRVNELKVLAVRLRKKLGLKSTAENWHANCLLFEMSSAIDLNSKCVYNAMPI